MEILTEIATWWTTWPTFESWTQQEKWVAFWAMVGGVMGGIGGIIAAIAGLPTLFSWVETKRKQKRLERELNSKFFSPETIENATRYYIFPDCSSIDPAQEAEAKHVIGVTHSLFETLDKYLYQNQKIRHLIVLADSGMGKTSCVLNYYARHLQHKKFRKKSKMQIVSLSRSQEVDKFLRDYPEKAQTILFLDAFDEDTQAIADHRARLDKILQLCQDFQRVVITCRTQFFAKTEEMPVKTGVFKTGAKAAGESGEYEFHKLYLAPLSDAQTTAYLKKRYPFWRRAERQTAQEMIQKIPQLSVRPMLLAHIPDLVAQKAEIKTAAEGYEAMVQAWIKREEDWVKDAQALRDFSERLAFDLMLYRQERGGERLPKIDIEALAKKWRISLEGWQLTGRSLLNRDAENYYKFAHRSIMEYLCLQYCLHTPHDERQKALQPTDQFISFLRDLKVKKNLSEWKLQGVNLRGAYLRGDDLREAKLNRADLSGTDLIKANLSGANLSGANLSGTNLREADLRGANLREANLREANLYISDLREANLSEADLRKADLCGANLRGANLSGADLSGAKLTRAKLMEADLSGADLSEADLNEAYLWNSNLIGATLSKADLRRANLSGANLSGANLSEANLSGANLSGANLSGANLSGANFEKAIFSEKTQPPDLAKSLAPSFSLRWWDASTREIIPYAEKKKY